MISKSFNTREKILLIILAVLFIFASYNLLVLKPSMATRSAAKQEIEEIADLLTVEQAKAEQIKKMQEELKQVGSTVESSIITPVFDNFQNLLDELNVALSTADSYKLNFKDPNMEEEIIKRELQLAYYANNYSSAIEIVGKLYAGPFRCDITSFKFVPTEKESNDLTVVPVTVNLNIIYYELNKNMTVVDVAAEEGTE